MTISSDITYRSIKRGDEQAIRDLYRAVQYGLADSTGDPAIASFMRQHVEEVFASDLADPVGHYSQPGHAYFLAHSGQVLVGMAGVEQWPGDPAIAKLRHVSVDPKWRRKRIASTILDHAEQWAAEAGYAALRLATSHIYTVAIGIYRGRGYRELDKYPGRATVTHVMEKGLRSGVP